MPRAHVVLGVVDPVDLRAELDLEGGAALLVLGGGLAVPTPGDGVPGAGGEHGGGGREAQAGGARLEQAAAVRGDGHEKSFLRVARYHGDEGWSGATSVRHAVRTVRPW